MIHCLTDRKKNALRVTIKSISLIEVEQKIIQWQLQNRKIRNGQNERKLTLRWTGSVADLVEFAYGALETRKFNDGEVDIQLLISELSKLFSFQVKDCYDTFRAIRRRVGSRTLFLDEMIDKLNRRMDDLDNGIFKKKKIRNQPEY